jgi:hypothetical protein
MLEDAFPLGEQIQLYTVGFKLMGYPINTRDFRL